MATKKKAETQAARRSRNSGEEVEEILGQMASGKASQTSAAAGA
jgi:hypothetical protein